MASVSPADEPYLRAAVNTVLALDRLWEGCTVGLILTEASLSSKPLVSAESLAAQAYAMSEDTARRRLQRLVDLGRAEKHLVHRRHFYKATAEAVRETLRLLNEIR